MINIKIHQIKKERFVLIINILLFTIVTYFLYFKFTTDDAFIHMTFAKSLAKGEGYNFAGNRVYGTTAPLWPILIALLYKIGINFEMSAKILSFTFAIASILLFYKIFFKNFDFLISSLSLFLYTFNPYVMRWAWSGMEATAATLFSLYLVYLLYTFQQNKRATILHYFILGFSPLIRPEFLLFLIIFFAYVIFIKTDRKFLYHIVITFLPSVVWYIFAYFHFGSIVPTTFMSKAGSPFFDMEKAIFFRNLKLFISCNLVEIFTLFIISILIFKKFGMLKNLKGFFSSICFPIFMCVFMFYTFYTLKNVKIISRYALPLIPYMIYLTACLLKKTFNIYNLKKQIVPLLMIFILFVLSSGVFTLLVVKPDADKFVNGFQKIYKEMAAMLFKEKTNNESVMLSDVGIIGLYSGMKM